MKHILLSILSLALVVGCINNPYVTVVSPDGTKTTYSTGRNLMGEVDEQVSEVEGPGGIHLRHMVKRQDATKVPIAFANTVGVSVSAYLLYLDRLAQQVTDRLLAGEITQREGAALLAGIEKERIAAGVSGSTVPNPNDGIVE